MKYIIVKGKANEGKTTTIAQVVKELNPIEIKSIIFDEDEAIRLVELNLSEVLENGLYLIKTNNLVIIIVIGAPTEIDIPISIIFNKILELKVNIDFAIIAVREREKDGFNSRQELQKFGAEIYFEHIEKIPVIDFKNTEDWKNRVKRILNSIEEN